MATTANPRTSILLQPYNGTTAATTLSASPSSSVSSSSFLASRHIRFAPLPDPRADTKSIHATDDCEPPPPLTEDISSSSSSSSSQLSSSTASTPLLPLQSDLDKSSLHSSLGSSIIQLSILPSKLPSTSPPSPPSSWVKNHLRPFKRFSTSSSESSSNTLTPTSSLETPKRSISTEEILTLGAVNLFRTASRDSSRDNDSSSSTLGWGLGLSRWSSGGRSNLNIPSGSSPLSRTQSSQSYKSNSFSRFHSFSSSSSSSSLSSDSRSKSKSRPPPVGQQPKTNKYKGTRMLNGRVYGAPKKNPNANPFANARDEEPEFVEWGYGGMGSIKGAKSAGVSTNWERLQGTSVGVGGVGAGIGAGDAELDDGSGLAWVKRRKEERERKAKEQKEKEEAEKDTSESQTNTPTVTRSSTLESVSALALPPSAIDSTPSTTDLPLLSIVLGNQDGEDSETATKANFPTPTPTRYPSELGISSIASPKTEVNTNTGQSKPEEGGAGSYPYDSERVLQAITVPVRSPRHYHHHRQSSKGELLVSPSTESPAILGSPMLISPNTSSVADVHASTVIPIELDKPIFPSSFSSSSSDSGSESEGEFGEDDTDDEEEEEDEERHIGRRKTGTAAGVEKISRHKE